MATFRNALYGLLASLVLTTTCCAQTAAILPNAKTQFFNANGQPLAGGKVYFYVPNTSTPKTTWQDAFEATPNAQPVVLDAGGTAFIFGAGNYTETLYDSNNNLIWSGFTYLPAVGTGPHTFGNGAANGAIFQTNAQVNDGLLYETVGGTMAIQTGISGIFDVTDQNANAIFSIAGPIKQANGGTTNGNNFFFISNICSIGDEDFTVTGTPTASETPGFAYKVGATTVNITYTVQPGDTNNSIAIGLANAVKNSSAMAGIINGTCPNGNYYNGTATAVNFGGGQSGFDIVYTADPNLAGNSWTALNSANTTITLAPISIFIGQPGLIWQANVPNRHAVANDEIYVGSYVFQDSTGAGATYLTDSLSVLSPTSGATTFQRSWTGGACGFRWSVNYASSAIFQESSGCSMSIGANGLTTSVLTLFSGSAGSINFNAGTAGIIGTNYFGGTAVGSTLTLSSTSNGSPLNDFVLFKASTVVVSNPSGSGAAVLQLGSNGTVGKLNFANATSGAIGITTPGGALGSMTQTLQDASDTFVYRATTDTLTNKTLSTATNTFTGSGASSSTFLRGDNTWATTTGGAVTYLCTITASNSASINNASPTSGTCPLNSSYTSYRLVFENLVAQTNEKIMGLQVHSTSGGASYKTSGYLSNENIFVNAAQSGSIAVTTYIPITFPSDASPNALGNATPGFSGEVTIINPSASALIMVYGNGAYLAGGAYLVTSTISGYWNTSAAVDGFQILMDSGNLTSGSVLVYGIN